MVKEEVWVTEGYGYIVETDKNGTTITADPNLFDTENIFKDKDYFITKEDEAKLRKYIDEKIGYDWQDMFQIFYVNDVRIEDDFYDVVHQAIHDILGNKILRYFQDEFKEE
jgi:hypothetical protein